MKLNKTISLIHLLVLLSTTTMIAQNNTFKWAKSIGTSTSEVGQSITVDASGNIYTTGYFQGTVDFDPGVGVTNLVSTGVNDIFITKFDASGNLIWAKSMGGTASDFPYSIAIDGTGNLYTTGYFSGTADFNPGVGTESLTSVGSNDIFISKLDNNGNFVWAKNIGSTSNDAAYAIKLDASSNIYITGYFSGTADFDPSGNVANLTQNGSGDAFVCKLDTDANYIWAKSIGGTSVDQGNTLNIDTSGNVYILGSFSNTVDFDSSANTANMTANVMSDIFICKLNTNGEYAWAKKFESATAKSGTAVAIDNSGNSYVAGNFAGTVDFDPSANTTNLTSAGGNDIYICKLNSTGDYVWAKSFGGTGADLITSITLDSDNNIYTTGSYTGTVDFDPSNATDTKVSNGNTDIFINKLDVNGDYIWTTSFGGTSADKGTSLIVDSSNNVITTGTFSTTVDFNPGVSVANLVSNGATDVFFSKLGTCVPGSWIGATNDLWNEASNWSCGVVPDISNDIVISSGFPILNVDLNIPVGKSITISETGTLTIAPGKTLTIAGSADFGGKAVIFQSDATGSGQFGPLTGTVTGANNIQVERYIPSRRAFRFLSPAVTTTTSIRANWQENGGSTAGLGT
ncbi:MAG: hypothetical protein RLY43_1924, partial [Bacteroidota bacterium]